MVQKIINFNFQQIYKSMFMNSSYLTISHFIRKLSRFLLANLVHIFSLTFLDAAISINCHTGVTSMHKTKRLITSRNYEQKFIVRKK